MSKIWMPGGGGGADLDVITVTDPSDVIAGKVIVDKEGEPLVGTLAFTGTALENQVLAGQTFYGTNPKYKGTGTMSVQSILAFSAAVYSSTAISFYWQNPAKGPFSGVIIVGKIGSYPTNIADGTRYYKGSGNNTAANGTSGITLSSFVGGVTYYFRSFSYAIKDNSEWIHTATYTSIVTTTKGQQVFTSSGTFTVPAGVRSIDLFSVGGGGGGEKGTSGGTSYYAGGSGGGGGYVYAMSSLSVTPGETIACIVGAGGAGGNANNYGGQSYFNVRGNDICLANGGRCGNFNYGGTGGSGGGTGGWRASNSNSSRHGGNGGQDGSNGWNGDRVSNTASLNQQATGMGWSTRAFHEPNNTIYAGGGGGGGYDPTGAISNGWGGSGGGGAGGNGFVGSSPQGYATPGSYGTGGGGGGGGRDSSDPNGTNGGSGVCIIRWGY